MKLAVLLLFLLLAFLATAFVFRPQQKGTEIGHTSLVAVLPEEPPPELSADFHGVDLSDAAVENLTREALWHIGTQYLRWPTDIPAKATKERIHQKLLGAKYSDVGDFDFGYGEIPLRRGDDR